MSGTVIYDGHGATVARSKNLRGLLRFASKHYVSVITIKPTLSDPPYEVVFYFDGGYQAVTQWQDWRALLEWLHARKSWGRAPDRFTVVGANLWSNMNAGCSAWRLQRLRDQGAAVTWRSQPVPYMRPENV